MTQSVPPRDIQTQPNVKINPPPNGIKSTDTKDPMFCHPLSKRMTSVPTDIRTTVPTSIKRTPKMVSPSIRVVSGPDKKLWIRKGKRLYRSNEEEKQKK
ncbi:hypothetical protein GCK72_002873 [Caenorhabditis remanei]|uniref:Uncharacterized protein n=1 Tax=Caenorhabditis remanei TaxID=31234 RepID=A0A6A5HSZ3_CAERE|nr:hypothetical protein GCK72_002873 [Caenorhabditis remanei]KAF1771048.1 hypothetical protein GCK72_002873 [Caenorhabditis remanei]